jgi:hypothetical protein
VEVCAGSAGAVYLYFLKPQIFVEMGVMLILAGANGGDNFVIEGLTDFTELFPQPEVKYNWILSPVADAELLVMRMTIF